MAETDIEKYIQAFTQIRAEINQVRWTSATYWRNPHKPFLILSILDLISTGALNTNLIEITPELEKIFAGYWKCFMPEHEGDIALPFFYLKGDNFWHLIPQPGKESMLKFTREINKISQLNKLVKGAKLDDELFQLLLEEKHCFTLRKAIIKSFFVEDIQEIVFKRGGANPLTLFNNQQPAKQEKKPSKDKPPEIKENMPLEKINDQFESLVYLSTDEWKPLPNWAKYFLELGSCLANYENEGKHFVVAITIPVRTFATAFIATGVIISRLNLPIANNEAQIKKIENLPLGTQVTFRRKNKYLYGTFNGMIDCNGKRYFLIHFEKDGDISIPIESASKIEVSEKSKKKLPKIQSGRQLAPPSPLLKLLLNGEILPKFTAESKLECVILGQQNIFQEELCQFELGLKLGDDRIGQGKLADLVRPRENQFQPSNFSYRSHIFPSSRKYNLQYTSKLNNYVTIFDNPLGFIKWRSYYSKSNWVVVLDKTANNYDLAIKEINEEYIQNRLEIEPKISLPNPPAGVELMVFEVKS